MQRLTRLEAYCVISGESKCLKLQRSIGLFLNGSWMSKIRTSRKSEFFWIAFATEEEEQITLMKSQRYPR